ncbi:uncharacterized protein B0P05DRAFT_497600 [Gilbertella persicaria]|uniref:GST N-terminal domain-containing protein n=1 Tax=Rhizopus stolonifer TaxID=4846 RepID=A0A367KXH4_RHIST|nr:uncharacterized protein B0P05DRAFT_497600 [Gilbertella persicaria]KAI8061535.1 hypothetical protein B0P05DRAFT_497600 [Gilbertella persicaria]RCI06901.1 hypothetical protein CU098_013673 [Rhizopus stolonifer]
MTGTQDIILHWYPESPYSQKVAWVLNYKKVEYRTVLCQRMEPRPLRRPLDGGYRKTPILQVGKHVFCDTKAIFMEIEKLFPEPSLYPKLSSTGASSEALARGLTLWADNSLFLNVVSQLPAKNLPAEFLADRSAMLGREIDVDKLTAAAPFMKATLLAEFGVLEKLLDGKNWILETEAPSLIDFNAAMMTFFTVNLVGEKWVQANLKIMFEHMSKLMGVADWEGTAKRPVLTEEEAIEVLKRHASDEVSQDFKVHSSGLPIELGQQVLVMPLDTGKVPVYGTLLKSTKDETVVEYNDPNYGTTAFIHFPALGFVVLPKPSSD